MKRTIALVCALGAGSLGVAAALLVAGPASAGSGTTSTSSTSTTTTSTSPLPTPTSTTSTSTAPSSTSSGSPSDKYGVINATVNAATDHEVAGSSAFPNFTTGAIDNYYTMAHSHIDNSPFSEGTSSPVDSGPLGQTAAAGNFSQPQYADARWPGKDSGKASFGNQGGPYAVAAAQSFKATADVSEASNGSGGSSSKLKIATPKGFAKRLRLALAAWKARWAVPLHLKTIKGSPISLTLPTVPALTTPAAPGVTTPTVTTPTVTTPKVPKPGSSKTKSKSSSSSSGDGGSVLRSSSSAELDQSSGAIVTSGQSSLGSISLGGGQIVLDGINVTVTVTNDGNPTDKVAVNVADASIGGVPVTIDQNGVQVQGQGQGLPFQQADDALNSALKQVGVQLFTVVPEVKKSTNELAVTASGVHVLFAQPVDAPGVPAQYAEHIFGEVFVDSLAAPAGPIPKLNLSGLGLSGSTTGGGTSGFGSGGIGGATGSSSTYGSSSPTAGTTGSTASQASPASFTSLLTKPTWLLIAYLVWQAMVIGTGASLWRWRTGGAT